MSTDRRWADPEDGRDLAVGHAFNHREVENGTLARRDMPKQAPYLYPGVLPPWRLIGVALAAVPLGSPPPSSQTPQSSAKSDLHHPGVESPGVVKLRELVPSDQKRFLNSILSFQVSDDRACKANKGVPAPFDQDTEAVPVA